MAEITSNDVMIQWKQDATIDETILNTEICRTPSLHSKYLQYYITFKDNLSKLEASYYRLGNMKRKYYRGECTKEDLDKYGWFQFQGLKPSNTELTSHLEFDKDMNNIKEKINMAKNAVAVCEHIMKNIAGRDYSIKSLVEYNKYLNGN